MCHAVYPTFDEATRCEALPTEPPKFLEGQMISYENEEGGFGSHYSYCGQSGSVIFAFLDRVDGNKHQWFYVVKDAWRELLVSELADRYGIVGLRSLLEWKYNPGFAEHCRQLRANPFS